jgi:hypothetical protein
MSFALRPRSSRLEPYHAGLDDAAEFLMARRTGVAEGSTRAALLLSGTQAALCVSLKAVDSQQRGPG